MKNRWWLAWSLLGILFSPGLGSSQNDGGKWDLGVQMSVLEYGLDFDFQGNENWAASAAFRARFFLFDHLFLDATYFETRERETVACALSGSACSNQLTGESRVFDMVAGGRFPFGLAEMSLGLSRGHFFNRKYDREVWGFQGTLGTMLSPRFGVIMEYRNHRIRWREDEVGWNQGFGIGVEVRARGRASNQAPNKQP
jgi:hypothetical protein